MSCRSGEGRPFESFRQVAPPSPTCGCPLGAAGDQETRVPAPLPGRCVEDVGIRGSHGHLAEPVSSEMWRPSRWRRRRWSCRGRGPRPRARAALRRDIDRLGVARVDDDVADCSDSSSPGARRKRRRRGSARPRCRSRPNAAVFSPVPSTGRWSSSGGSRSSRSIHRVVLEDGLPGGAPVRGLEGVPGSNRDVPGGPVVRVDGHVGDPAGGGQRGRCRGGFRPGRRSSVMAGDSWAAGRGAARSAAASAKRMSDVGA